MEKEKEKKVHMCLNCGKIISLEEITENSGFCTPCEEEGLWIDPAGGIHSGEETDLAAMYE